jgi:hypothetical protein
VTSQGLPTTLEMLAELERAGGWLPQSAFGTEYNDAGDMLFRGGYIDCDPEEVRLTEAGRARLQASRKP